LVEDQEVNQMLAVELLERWGFRADVVDNGLEALDAMGRTEYGLVLMDCQMPGMDGFEATQAIRRAEPAGRRVPIIAMTANAMLGDRERCLEAGMDDYISKPIDPQKVLDTIQRWLPMGPMDESPPTPSVAVAAPYMDEGQLRSLVGNDPVKLRKYLRLFVTSAEPTLHALDAAVRTRDQAGLRRHAHNLRGSSANIGAAEMALAAGQLEQLPAEDWGRAENLRTHLWQTYTRTRAYADAI
jgi:two-component system sensor histidine kinase/response regulator